MLITSQRLTNKKMQLHRHPTKAGEKRETAYEIKPSAPNNPGKPAREKKLEVQLDRIRDNRQKKYACKSCVNVFVHSILNPVHGQVHAGAALTSA